MPRELPGFYFDAEKNRYFPSSSKQAGKSHPPYSQPPADRPHTSEAASPSSSTPPPQNAQRRSHDAWHTLQLSRLVTCPRQRIATLHQMMTAQLEASAAYQAIPIPVFTGRTLTAFAAGVHDGRIWSIAGDSYGVLHAFDPSPPEDLLSMPSHVLQHSWTRKYRLDSQISSIRSSGLRWVATSFGSTILVHDLPSTRTVKVSLSPDLACDVWTSHLRDRSLVLGVRKRALLMQDVESSTVAWRLETQSDVFALHQEECLVYTGSRNGSIRRFDTRSRGPGLTLLGDAFTKSSNSITYLNIIKDWQLLVTTIRGAIEIFDIRFLQEARPLLRLVGHVNSYQPSLPQAITPSQDFFFAAGLDNRIRGWSLLTGEPLSCPHPRSTLEVPSHQLHPVDMDASPFRVKFEEQITSLEITEVGHELCLFATSGSGLHRFILGRRFPYET
ncbi:hypothetical protein DFH94DRAFT_81016 [Russula ochroleuca]|uniref:WD40 repeat-like protein n=1 Tax=Russula ochroleuca TaxID=152965 RepID=A0A9P5MTB3_9AGAM|nr:hypothetical protein DFH94DRAFT_81016 [Russula ochroleuca]